jgi:GntR family transcriptional regulator, transcriptional repressor for pyruvate dehydrogenase complex
VSHPQPAPLEPELVLAPEELALLFDPVRSIRTFETAIDHIVAGIERGRLREGARMPNESALALQLGISKPTLRQALRVLEQSGLIAVKAGKTGGIFVRSNYLPTEAISTHVADEEDAILQTLRARRVLESAVTVEALGRATDADFAEIERTVDLLVEEGITTEELLRADMMFHRAVSRASHNRVLEESLRTLYKHLAGLRELTQRSEASLVFGIHERQLLAMRSRDADALAVALDEHFRYLEERFAASLRHSWAELFADGGAQPTLAAP